MLQLGKACAQRGQRCSPLDRCCGCSTGWESAGASSHPSEVSCCIQGRVEGVLLHPSAAHAGKQGNYQTKQGFKINSTRIIRMLNSRSSHYRATQRFPIKELLTLAGFFQSSRMKICCSGVQIGGFGGSDGSLPLLLHAGIHPGRGCVVFPVKMVQIKCKE